MVEAKGQEDRVDSKGEEGASQRVSLLDSCLAVDDGRLSFVEITERARAAVMCLDVVPQDVPSKRPVLGLGDTRKMDVVVAAATLLKDCCNLSSREGVESVGAVKGQNDEGVVWRLAWVTRGVCSGFSH